MNNSLTFEAYDFKHNQPVKVKSCEGDNITLYYRFWTEEVQSVPSYIKKTIPLYTFSVLEKKTGKLLSATQWEDIFKVHFGWGSEEYTREEFEREFEEVK